ncbi:MAG: DnaJ domain-containing protein [Dehalococcoidales bacterium]|nr:DnaJ domain-containing protein [Dehalococcoidales bacterium]
MGPRVDANRTRNDLRHMFDLWGIDQFSIIREQEEYVSGGVKRGNGVTVTYFRKGEWQTVFCNLSDFATNMRSIFLFMDRVRISEKSGIFYQGLSSTKDLVKSSFDTKPAAEETLEDAYDVLGVSRDDPTELIKKVYVQKVKFYHPDKGGDPEKFKRITKAYEAIMADRGGKV